MAEDGYVYGLPVPVKNEGKLYPIIRVMTESALQGYEQEIRDSEELTRPERAARISALRGNAWRMALDKQNRVVLPAHHIGALKLDREAYVFEANGVLQVWNPSDWSDFNSGDMLDSLADFLL